MSAALVFQPRICDGANHQPGCHHRRTMAEGVMAFLTSERARVALIQALASSTVPSLGPEREAERILEQLATVAG